MKNINFKKIFIIILSTAIVCFCSAAFACSTGNIDPAADGHQYAWAENTGWINFQPDAGPGVTVTDTGVTGMAWGENIGWITLDLLNDGTGNLSGCAWGENGGWISFSCETTSCDSVVYGVYIDPVTGEFSGKAWGENTGWINFEYDSASTYGVKTLWASP